MEDKPAVSKVTKVYQICRPVKYPPRPSMTARHRHGMEVYLYGHGVDQSDDTLLCDGISLNLQKLGQVSQVAVGVDVGICRSLQLVPQGWD